MIKLEVRLGPTTNTGTAISRPDEVLHFVWNCPSIHSDVLWSALAHLNGPLNLPRPLYLFNSHEGGRFFKGKIDFCLVERRINPEISMGG